MNEIVDNPPLEVTQDFLRRLVRQTEGRCLERTEDGYYVFLCGSATVTSDIKEWAREKVSVLINPTRRDYEQYMPRTTYYADHRFDELDPEGICIVMHTKELFWRKHQRDYREWYDKTR